MIVRGPEVDLNARPSADFGLWTIWGGPTLALGLRLCKWGGEACPETLAPTMSAPVRIETGEAPDVVRMEVSRLDCC